VVFLLARSMILWKRNYEIASQKLGMLEKGMIGDAHPTYFVNLFLLFPPPATFSHNGSFI
jgi:hypothetical protein